MENSKDFDKQIINISLTLLTCFFGFVFLVQEKNLTEIWFSIGTIFLLSTTTISTAWYQHRYELRKRNFKDAIKKFADTSLRSSLEAINKLGKQDGLEESKNDYASFLKENSELVNSKSKEEISFFLHMYMETKAQSRKQSQNKSNEFIEIVAESLASRVRDTHKQSFEKPLNEKYAKIKCFFDVISLQYRTYFFILSLISFLLTVILLLI